MTRIEDNDVVHTFAVDRSYEAFLPRRPGRDHDLFDTHPLNPSAENWTVRGVSVLQQIPRCGVPRKGLGNLVGEPHLCGILGCAEMNDFSPVMFKHDQSIQDPKCRGRDNEYVDRRGVSQVVVQKAAPSRGGVLGRRRRYLPTVAWLISTPSLSNSPWMRLAVRLQAVAHIAQEVADNGGTNFVASLRQPLRKVTQAAAGPQQGLHWIAPGCRFYQILEVGDQSWIFRYLLLAAGAALA
jgi:hypothetical protein